VVKEEKKYQEKFKRGHPKDHEHNKKLFGELMEDW